MVVELRNPTDQYKQINFNAVSETLNVKPNTAYKRYAGLVKIFESENDQAEDKNGTMSAAPAKDGPVKGTKRKNAGGEGGAKKGTKMPKVKIEEEVEEGGVEQGDEAGEEENEV